MADSEEMSTGTSQLKQLQAVVGAPQTGRYDDATIAAVKAFQRGMGLEETGYPNQETIDALKKMGGESMMDLSWFDWAIIYLVEYKWWAIGLGIGVLGGIGYWAWKRKRRK